MAHKNKGSKKEKPTARNSEAPIFPSPSFMMINPRLKRVKLQSELRIIERTK